jgi:hypothetical protein
VAATGDDRNSGTAARPLRNLNAAMRLATPGSVIELGTAHYPPVTVRSPSITISSAPGQHATIDGRVGIADNVLVLADHVTLSNLTISGCTPDRSPSSSLEVSGSAGVRVGANADGTQLRALSVSSNYGTNSDGLSFGCYGITINGNGTVVEDSRLSHNGYGVFVYGSASGTIIRNNMIYDNNVLIRNTRTSSNDDFGADGIGFTNTDNALAEGNWVFGNVGPSHDFGTDGGAFEIFNSSTIVMKGNVAYQNADVVETGAGPGGQCVGNSFVGNTASGAGTMAQSHPSVGMILRCANSMTISNNTLANFDWWTFWIYQPSLAGGGWGGDVKGLAITGNTISQQANSVVLSMTTPMIGLDVVITQNRYTYQNAFAIGLGGKRLSQTEWETSPEYR